MEEKEVEQKIVNRVKEIRESRGLSQEYVAEQLGKGRGQISRLENGKSGWTGYWLNALSDILECEPGELISEMKGSSVPVYGEVPGGDCMLATQNEPTDFIPFETSKKDVVGLRVRGNSMSRIAPDGSYVVVDTMQTNPNLLNNQPVILLIDNGYEMECSFKIFKTNPERFEPYSIEAGYDTIFPENKDWKIFGAVIGTVGFIGEDAKLIERGS